MNAHLSHASTEDGPGPSSEPSRSVRRLWLERAGFLAALVVAGELRETADGALGQAVIWLPSGVAVAGLWMLGLRNVWIVALAALALRIRADYFAVATIFGAAGAAVEALLGASLASRLRIRPDFARLKDALGLLVVSAASPLGSIAMSWLGRIVLDESFRAPIYSGWDGWWRMNALGVLVAVPLASTAYRSLSSLRAPRQRIEAAVVMLGLIAVITIVMTTSSASSVAMLLLYAVVPIALYAAVRLGPLGAASTAALASLVVALSTDRGLGPFVQLPEVERHDVLQTFTFALATVPLLLGALIAEREAAFASRVSSEAARSAFERLLPDLTCRVRADGTVVDVHIPAHLELTLAREALLGRSLTELVPRSHADGVRNALAAAMKSGAVATLEVELGLDGRRQPCEARFVRWASGEALCLVRDISARKHEQDIGDWQARVLELVAKGRPSRESLTALVEGLEQLSDGAMASLLLLEGRVLRVSIGSSLPPEFNKLVDGVEIGPAVGSCGTAAFTGRTVVVSDIYSDPLWVAFVEWVRPFGLRACWSVPVRGADRSVLGTFAVYYRAPRSPRAGELALLERAAALAGIAIEREQREELLSSINRNVNEGLFRSSPARGFHYVNDAMVRMLGYESAAQLMAVEPVKLFVEPALQQQMRARVHEFGAVSSEEVALRRRDGSTVWVLVSAVGWRGPDGRVEYYDGAMVDATARRSLEEKLRQAQKMEAVGRLAGGVAHDFNNLLTAIGGYAEALLARLPSGAQTRRDVERILEAADRAASLTRQLLAYSRQQVLSPQVHDLTRVVDELGDLLRRLIGEHIRLSIEHALRGLSVNVDRGQIEQVVLNLALNARDALPNGGALAIRTAPCELDEAFVSGHENLRAGSYVRLTVADDGVGMDELTRQRAFDPFFTTKEQGKGTGLGLSTVYGIVSQSGGVVLIESRPSEGALVSVFLPRMPTVLEVAAAIEPRAPATQAARSTGLILVAEDEPMVREIVKAGLRSIGYEVLEADNGERALELARERLDELDLVLSDRIMPRMGGDELAEHLHRARPDLPVLLMSGYAEVATPRGAARANLLQKPFTRDELLRRVRETIGQPAQGERSTA